MHLRLLQKIKAATASLTVAENELQALRAELEALQAIAEKNEEEKQAVQTTSFRLGPTLSERKVYKQPGDVDGNNSLSQKEFESLRRAYFRRN